MTATEISYYSTMHKTKVSRAIFALEQKRWLVREVDENDRRLERITLTEQGQKAYESLVPKMQQVENELIDRLGEENSSALFKGLAALEELYLDKETARRSRKAR
jgi:DNA-binding MarR family transcriptional regulator